MTFEVNQNNKLVYQEEVLKDFTGKYSVEVKGSACASLQVSQNLSYGTLSNWFYYHSWATIFVYMANFNPVLFLTQL